MYCYKDYENFEDLLKALETAIPGRKRYANNVVKSISTQIQVLRKQPDSESKTQTIEKLVDERRRVRELLKNFSNDEKQPSKNKPTIKYFFRFVDAVDGRERISMFGPYPQLDSIEKLSIGKSIPSYKKLLSTHWVDEINEEEYIFDWDRYYLEKARDNSIK